MKIKPLVSLKGTPIQIKVTIKYVKETQDLSPTENWERLWNCLSQKLPELSPGNPRPESLISAQALPTAERLDIITRDQKNRRLKQNGYKLLEQKSEEEYKLCLGKILLEFDNKHNKIIPAIRNIEKYPGAQVRFIDLVIELWKLGIDACQDKIPLDESDIKKMKELGITINPNGNKTRLIESFRYYEYADLVITKKYTVSLKHAHINKINETQYFVPLKKISNDRFFKSLYETYNKYLKEYSKNIIRTPYVPIPILREMVAGDKNIRINDDDFMQKLSTFPTIFKNKKIIFSQHMEVKPIDDMIKKGKSYYYYISIRDAEEN